MNNWGFLKKTIHPTSIFHKKKALKIRKKKAKQFKNKEEYYKSREWEIKRAVAIRRARESCERCGRGGKLDVHHLTYDRLYNEPPDDLVVLCRRCHEKADRQREEDTRYQNALDTYLEKKYGEGVDYFPGCEEEFEAWLERKGDYYY